MLKGNVVKDFRRYPDMILIKYLSEALGFPATPEDERKRRRKRTT